MYLIAATLNGVFGGAGFLFLFGVAIFVLAFGFSFDFIQVRMRSKSRLCARPLGRRLIENLTSTKAIWKPLGQHFLSKRHVKCFTTQTLSS
jgi:hypothetical protein